MLSRETFLFCVVPTVAVMVGTALAATSGLTLAQSPAMLYVAALLGVSAISVFLAHFSPAVHNAAAWGTIALNGFLVILFFACLHQSVGIQCAANWCPGTQAVQVAPDLLVEMSTDFPTALYFSVVSFTTLGYGDFQPHPDLRLAAALEALLGYMYLGLTVGAAIDLGSKR